nr:MAM and LDL-receptor class A domain-containing protein 2-like [Cherax quadricarinatus]
MDNVKDDSDWIAGCGSSSEDLDAPDADHNGNNEGMFLYVDTAFASTGLALLQSQMFITQQHSNLCFHFWYFIQGTTDDVLWIAVKKDDGINVEVWQDTASSDHGRWLEGQVHIDAQELFIATSYQIFIGGMRGTKFAIISVDDFNFTKNSEECPNLPSVVTTSTSSTLTPTTLPSGIQSVSCNFTDGVCGWVNVDAEGIHWDYNSEKKEMELQLEGTEVGQYYVGEMRSPNFTLGADSSSCLTLTWFMTTEEEAHLSVIIQNELGQDIDLLMNVNDGSDGQWRSTNMDFTKEGTYRISIKGTVTSSWQGFMAFNSVLLVDEPCSEEVKAGGLWCDFETPEECGFRTSLPGDTTVWTWGADYDTLDHTLDSHYGHTMYVDLSLVGEDKVAHLVTPAITPQDETFCATFWFYIFGEDGSRLSILSIQNESPSLPLWSQHQAFEKEWRGASVSNTVDLNKNFTVVFEVFTGKGAWGSIGVDDVKVTPGYCPDPTTCTFDDGLCLWTQSYNDDLDWEVVSVAGDLHDHTSDSGNFLILRADNYASVEKTALLESFPGNVLEVSCFSFWYSMWGHQMQDT